MKDLRQELKQALQEGRAYDFIANEGYQFSKDELIEIIKNYDYTLYQLAKGFSIGNGKSIERVMSELGSMIVDNLNDYDFFEEDEDIDFEELIKEVEEEDLEELKDDLKSRFNEIFKGNERLLAIQLNGFSHSVIYDFGEKTSQIIKDEFSHYTDGATHKLYKIFDDISHYPYQNNAKEFVYIRPEER